MCVNYRHLGPGARGKAAPNGLTRGGGGGTRGAQTLRFPGFYARPRSPSVFGSLFRKIGLRIRVARTLFYFFNTPRMKTRFFVIIGKSAKSVGNCSLFSWVQKTSVSAERCRKNRDNDFQSGFVSKIGCQNMHYSFVVAHDSKTAEESRIPDRFFVFLLRT